MIPWSYVIADEDIDNEIARYRDTPAGKSDTRTDTELRPYAVNTIVARKGPKLGEPNSLMSHN